MIQTKLPHSLISKAIKEDKLDSLAYWVLMRHRFEKRAIFYDWSYRGVAKKMDISPNTAKKHIKYLLDADMLFVEGSNLVFRGRDSLLKEKETPIPILVGKNKKEQVLFFRNAILAANIKRQEKRIKKKASIVTKYNSKHGMLTKRQYNRIDKMGGINVYEESIGKRTCLSVKKLGQKLNRSESSAKRYKKSLTQAGLIKATKHREVFKINSSWWDYENNFKGTGPFIYYERSKCIMVIKSDTISLSGRNLALGQIKDNDTYNKKWEKLSTSNKGVLTMEGGYCSN